MGIKNFEFKARVYNLDNYDKKLLSLDPAFHGIDEQVDTYFRVSKGRLKIREGNIENALIYYERDDVADVHVDVGDACGAAAEEQGREQRGAEHLPWRQPLVHSTPCARSECNSGLCSHSQPPGGQRLVGLQPSLHLTSGERHHRTATSLRRTGPT